ncbi:MAG TPA: dynamin family protein [Jiangellaceae bacterium]|nr:dynamin family protein [Jiangellaceae bacterium]
MTINDAPESVLDALGVLRERVGTLRLPLELPRAPEGRRTARQIVAQLDDYVLPRLREIDAPLLAVVGGSTGAGKSTLVNALVGRPVSPAGVLRPTTRAPVLVYHPGDAEWFTGDRILPGLARVTGEDLAGPGTLHMVADDAVPQGLALLDAPDIDSVVSENRELATQLLAAADLWLFVTSAARYADAVPWDLLRAAVDRSAVVAVVLDRVPAGAEDEVRHHLASMLDLQGLGAAPLFVVGETKVDDEGMLPPGHVASVSAWLDNLASDAGARADVVRRTLDGAVAGIVRRSPPLAEAADDQYRAAKNLRASAELPYAEAVDAIDRASRDGTLLRGEVLARWQDFVGTGEFFRSLEDKVGVVRDRITAFVRGRPQPAARVEEAIEHGLHALLVDEADRAAERADASWRADPAGRHLLGADDLSRSSPGLGPTAAEQVRAWQGAVLDLVRTEGQDKRYTARVLSFGLNGLAIALMVVVFASTAGLTGAEIGIAGGAAVVGQKLLEAIFGDQAIRRLADAARADLRRRAEALMAIERARFTDRLDTLVIDSRTGQAIREALVWVGQAREREAAG